MGTNSVDTVSSALFPRSRRTVLGILYGDPERPYYLREIIDLAGLGSGQIQRELARLSEAGILRRFEQGRHVYFQADPQCPVYEELRSLVTKSVRAGAVVATALRDLADRIRVAFIFGSVARGDERSQSDLDLLVVSDVSFSELVEALSGAETTLRREIHPSLFSEDEFRNRLASKDHFLDSVLREEKVFVIGVEDELGVLLTKSVDQEA
jgi:predicted nucleotidyltransferase